MGFGDLKLRLIILRRPYHTGFAACTPAISIEPTLSHRAYIAYFSYFSYKSNLASSTTRFAACSPTIIIEPTLGRRAYTDFLLQHLIIMRLNHTGISKGHIRHSANLVGNFASMTKQPHMHHMDYEQADTGGDPKCAP